MNYSKTDPSPLKAIPGNCKVEEKKRDCEFSIDQMRSTIQYTRQQLAGQIYDVLSSIEKMDEKEFVEVISTLDSGIDASVLIEKFRKYKGIE